MSDFTQLQEIFIIVFPIFYVVLLGFAGGIRAFDTATAFNAHLEAIARFALAVIFINIIPFAYFTILLFYGIPKMNYDTWSIMVVFALSLSVFGFSRIYYGIILGGKNHFYYKDEVDRMLKEKSQDKLDFSRHFSQQLFPGLLYVLIPLGFYFILIGMLFYGILLIILPCIATAIAYQAFKHKLTD